MDLTTVDLARLHPLDPRPFYRAVLDDPKAGDEALGDHDIEHRPGLVWNAAIKTIRLWFGHHRPGNRPRQGLLNLYQQVYGGTYDYTPLPLDVIALYIDLTFDAKAADELQHVDMQLLCTVALMLPSPIARHYAWRPGEREAHITTLALFDHTFTDTERHA